MKSIFFSWDRNKKRAWEGEMKMEAKIKGESVSKGREIYEGGIFGKCEKVITQSLMKYIYPPFSENENETSVGYIKKN